MVQVAKFVSDIRCDWPLRKKKSELRQLQKRINSGNSDVNSRSFLPPSISQSVFSFCAPPLVTLRHLHRKIASAATDVGYPHASTPPPQQKHIPEGDDTLGSVERELSITVGKQGGDEGDMQISSLSYSLILNPRKLPGASGGEE